MLKVRRAEIESVEAADSRLERVTIRLSSGQLRPAISYPQLTGSLSVGERVLVNTEALDLGLGSGGYDIVLAGLGQDVDDLDGTGAHAMKLNYTPLQHSVNLIEEHQEEEGRPLDEVIVLALHSQLSAAAFALKADAPDARVAYLQTAGGALPGALSDTVAELIERDILSAHVTVSPCFGAPYEAATVIGAVQACQEVLGCGVALVGPGPGIQGSASRFGHGGMQALESAQAGLCLGVRPVLAPRVSEADSRERHRGLSHHTATVLAFLLAPVEVAIAEETAHADLVDALRNADRHDRHVISAVATEDHFDQFLESGLPAECMGRRPRDDPSFFRQALAAGRVAARKIVEG